MSHRWKWNSFRIGVIEMELNIIVQSNALKTNDKKFCY